jgi:uncharacterized protein YaiI (UPF0178 family)
MNVHIWVDADACPGAIKETLYYAADRVGVPMTLVANQTLRTPSSSLINTVKVASGPDVADDYIVEHLDEGDLVITADIPLAASAIEKGAHVINPRGMEYDEENIGHYLGMRNFMEEIRSAGQISGGPPPFSQRECQDFTNALDRFLTRCNRP